MSALAEGFAASALSVHTAHVRSFSVFKLLCLYTCLRKECIPWDLHTVFAFAFSFQLLNSFKDSYTMHEQPENRTP